MSASTRGRTIRRILGILVAGMLVVTAAIIGLLADNSRAPAAPSPASLVASKPIPHRSDGSSPGDRGGVPTEADGVVPKGVTVFDDEYPAVGNLDPALLRALRKAAADAARDGVELYVDSGWRSARYQQELLEAAISKYGSEREAARWVATPSTSAHVSGKAVDVGPSDAAAWLSGHGAEYGLCRIYGNEPWHYELRPAAATHGCPATFADATHDPRMHG